MKKILSPGLSNIKVFRAKCPFCDCEFQYQIEDVIDVDGFYEGRRCVSCPECGKYVDHNRSTVTITRMVTESL